MASQDTQKASTSLVPSPSSLPPLPAYNVHQSVLRTPDLDDVESVDTYKPGGHHPVDLGDVLGQRYKTVHKLGNGGFALVWLARDLDEHRYVALKVLRADAPNSMVDREVNALEHAQAAAASGAPGVARLYEVFTISGPNGIHKCLVMDVGGPSLRCLSLYCKSPHLQFIKGASQKLAEGLATLHSAGICHGDLTHSNVLFELKSLQAWTESQIYRFFGTPQTAPLLLLNGLPAPPFAPHHVVNAVNYSHFDIDQLSGNVLIIDFGEAYFKDSVPNDLGTPASFYAPELLFKYPPSYAADLWALGCLIFEMHTFHTLLPTAFGSVLEALAIAVETIGALPAEWLDRGQTNPQLTVDRNNRLFDDSIERTRTFDSQISELMPDLSREEHATFVELLKSIIVFEPTCRLSAEAVGTHLWFKED